MIRRWWPLGLVALVVMLLALAGVIPRWPGLVAHVALPPLDLFADVRVLAVKASSPTVFVIGTLLICAARVALLASVIGRTRRALHFAMAFYGIALPFGLVATMLDVASRAALYAYLFWVGLATTLVSYFLLGALPWTGSDRLRGSVVTVVRRGPRFAVLVSYLAALGALAVIVRWPGDAIQVMIVPLGAGLTALAATRLGARSAWTRRTRAAAAVVTCVVAVTATILTARMDDRMPRPTSRPGSLVLVAGVATSSGSGSLFRFPPRALGYSCAQTYYFSYAGTGRGAAQKDAACPIRTGAPYRKADTLRPLTRLASTFRRQIAKLPGPVTVVTHSQGAWVAWAGLAASGHPEVGHLVMLGPFPESLTAYPPPGESGRGAMAGVAVRAVTDVANEIGFSTFDPDAPLARELQGTAGAIEAVLAEPLPRSVHAVAIASRFDLPLAGGNFPAQVTVACPGWSGHGGLPTSADTLATARRFIDGRPVARCPGWTRGLAHAIEIFGAPPPQR